MAAHYADALHEAMVALCGDINWFDSNEWLVALHNAGATFVNIGHVRALLRSASFASLDEHFNPLGFYRKLKGAKLLVQVRRPGAQPDLSRFPPWAPVEGETRGWRLRDELPAELKARLRAHLRLPAEDVESASSSADGGARGGGAAAVPPARPRRGAALALPGWASPSIAPHGGWEHRASMVGSCRFERRGADGDIVVVAANVTANDDGESVALVVTVLDRTLQMDGLPRLDEAGLRRLLRTLGTSYICPGVGELEISPYARSGFVAVAARAVCDNSTALLFRLRSSVTIGSRLGGDLENATGAFDGVAPGPRFRATDCELCEDCSEEKWADRRGAAAKHCQPCAAFLRSLIQAAKGEQAKSATATGDADASAGAEVAAVSKYTPHCHLARDNPDRVRAALAAAAARTSAARQKARRLRIAIKKIGESHEFAADCDVATALTSKFEELQQSDEFERCFPDGSVARFLWYVLKSAGHSRRG